MRLLEGDLGLLEAACAAERQTQVQQRDANAGAIPERALLLERRPECAHGRVEVAAVESDDAEVVIDAGDLLRIAGSIGRALRASRRGRGALERLLRSGPIGFVKQHSAHRAPGQRLAPRCPELARGGARALGMGAGARCLTGAGRVLGAPAQRERRERAIGARGLLEPIDHHRLPCREASIPEQPIQAPEPRGRAAQRVGE